MDLITTTAVLTANAARRETLEGREMFVVPVVAIIPGVLNGRLIPEAEVSAFAQAWNGVPIPILHPTDGSGENVTANTVDVIEGKVVGRMFNVQFVDRKLKGELWIDVEKSKRLGGDALAALEALERGEKVEVSTAFFHRTRQQSGAFNGKNYTSVAYDIKPDHIALLPGQIGACSITDGCGAGLSANSSMMDWMAETLKKLFGGQPAPAIYLTTNQEAPAMTKQEKVAKLIALAVALEPQKAQFEALSDEVLDNLIKNAETITANKANQPGVKPCPCSQVAANQEAGNDADPLAEIKNPALRAFVKRALENDSARRTQIVEKLFALKGNKIPKERLMAMDLGDLEALGDTILSVQPIAAHAVTDFSGAFGAHRAAPAGADAKIEIPSAPKVIGAPLEPAK